MAEGVIEDDPSLLDDHTFLRRVPPMSVIDCRPDSANFAAKTGEGLSVTLWGSDDDLERTEKEAPSFGIVSIKGAELRSVGYVLVRAPLPENPNHCDCFGKINKGPRRRLARAARWVKAPDGFKIDEDGLLVPE